MSLKTENDLRVRDAEIPLYSPRGPRFPRWLPLLALAVIIGGALYWRSRQSGKPAGGGREGGAGGAAGARGPQVPVVRTVAVSVGNLVQTLPVTGSLRSNQNVDLNSKIQGRVARVYVQEGSRVRRGQLLIELDDEDLRASVASARAGLRSAQARLGQTVVGVPARVQQVGTSIQAAEATLQTARARLRQSLLNEPLARTTAQNQVESARETVRTARARLDQSRRTARQVDLETQAAVRSAEAGVRTAQAGVRGGEANIARAQAALAEVRRGAREQQVAQAQAQVNLAEANLRDAETELNRQRILFNGGAAPRASVDAAQTRYDVNRAQLEVARQSLSLVQEGATNEQVRQATELVRQAQEAAQQGEEGVRSAQANLSQARAGRLRATTEQGNITAALAALGQAQSGLQTAQAGLAQIPIRNQETLVAQEAVGQAESALSQARANRSQIPIARSDVNIARAAVQTAQSQLDQALVQLAYARIYSPVNGVVNTKLADVGETTGQGVALLNLVSLDRVYFEAQIPESSIRGVRAGQSASIIVPAVSTRPIAGFVSDIIPVADVRLRQFRVRVTLPDAPRELTPGAFARGAITTQTISNALIAPQESLQARDKEAFVLLAIGKPEAAQVKRRVVSTGISVGGRTQILGGVQRGDRIIMNEPSLEDGDKIRLAKNAG